MPQRSIIGLLFSSALFAQSPSFDAATIKPAEPSAGGMIRVGVSGGPGTSDPGLFRCDNCTLSMLIIQAWDSKNYQLPNAAALDANRFTVVAKVPAGATKDQFHLMLQNLLSERFKLTVHREKKEMPEYDLVVVKGGSKLKPAAPVDPGAQPEETQAAPFRGPGQRMELDKYGFPVAPKSPGHPFTFIMNGRARTEGTAVALADLANFLANQVGGKPVLDATGLQGKYDYSLTWAPQFMAGMKTPPPPDGHDAPSGVAENAEPLPNIFAALQEQLGLKLEPKRGMVDILVVDHFEKTPSDN